MPFFINMNKEAFIKLLSAIKHPKHNKSIIDLGLLANLRITDNEVIIDLQSEQDGLIRDQIINKISDKTTKKIKINFLLSNAGPSFQSPNQYKPIAKNIIAIASGKGGVGKSTIAFNIAIELAKSFKVGILDLDIYGPSLPTLSGVNEQPRMQDGNIVPINKFNLELMSFGFINTESSPAIWRGPMVSRMTQQFFDNVLWSKDLDYLILDLPPGTGDIQLTLVQKVSLTGAIMITTPQDLSRIDVQKGTDMFKKVNTEILGVVENMSGLSVKGTIYSNGQALNNGKLILEDNIVIEADNQGSFELDISPFIGQGGLDESERNNVPLLGKIPLDRKISESSDIGVPYINAHPLKSGSKVIQKICDNIISSLA